MAALVPGDSAFRLLTLIRNDYLLTLGWLARVYNNDVTPTCTSGPGDFVPANYMPALDLETMYSAVTSLSACVVAMIIEVIEWEQTADEVQTAYGWYVTDGNGDLVFAERFPVPIDLTVAGDKVSVLNHLFRLRRA